MTRFSPGDLLFFSSPDWVSRGIALATCSPRQLWRGHWFSHVGVVAEYEPSNRMRYESAMLYETTMLCKQPCVVRGEVVKGAQLHFIWSRIEKHDGYVWVMRPKRPLSPRQARKLREFLTDGIERRLPYDTRGAVRSGTRLIKYLSRFNEDLDAIFCSEWALAGLEEADVVGDRNASTYSPASLAAWLEWIGKYHAPELIKPKRERESNGLFTWSLSAAAGSGSVAT